MMMKKRKKTKATVTSCNDDTDVCTAHIGTHTWTANCDCVGKSGGGWTPGGGGFPWATSAVRIIEDNLAHAVGLAEQPHPLGWCSSFVAA